MDRSPHGRHKKGSLIVLASLVGLLFSLTVPNGTVFAQAKTKAEKSIRSESNAEAGRNIFNGKGACYYCHGTDGYRDKLPQIESDTAALIAQLSPQPADLRNAKVLNLKTDKQRARAIREGHRGTGMFPDTTMTDQELTDTLAYLSLLRREGTVRGR